ncbi:MAG: hypothetical protein QXP38_05815 [Nitrososphaerota archaeon]
MTPKEILELEQRLAELRKMLREKEEIARAPLEAEELRRQIHKLEVEKRKAEQACEEKKKHLLRELGRKNYNLTKIIKEMRQACSSLEEKVELYYKTSNEIDEIREELERLGLRYHEIPKPPFLYCREPRQIGLTKNIVYNYSETVRAERRLRELLASLKGIILRDDE